MHIELLAAVTVTIASVAVTGKNASAVECRVCEVVISLAVCALACDSEGFRKSLVVYDLSCAEEFDGFADIGIVCEAEDVVVGKAGLLLWYDFVRTTSH